MKESIGKIIFIIIGGIITAAISFWFGGFQQKNFNQKRFFDIKTYVSHQILDKSELEEKKMQILYDGKQIYGVTNVRVDIYNYEDKSFENVPVIIEITPDKGDSLQIVDVTVFGENGREEMITPLKNIGKASTSKALKFGYNIDIAHQADSSEKTVLTVIYGIISNKKPKVEVIIKKFGIGTRTYDYQHFKRLSLWDNDVFILFFFVSLLVIYIWGIIKLISFIEFRKEEKWVPFLKDELTKKIDKGEIEFKTDSIIKAYNEISEKFNLKNTWIIKRWLNRNKHKVTNTNLSGKNISS